MATRREVLGAGLAFASVSSAIGVYSAGREKVVRDKTGLPKVGAVVLDERLGASTPLVDYLRNRRPDLPFLAIRLDSPTLTQLKHLFERKQMVVGISCGATLFCLERIAWDHGYRIARRSEHEFSTLVNHATVVALADAIMSNKSEPSHAAATLARRAYRPSRTDDTLHAWVMQTAVASRQRTVRQEIRG